jgi:hypothetical protein
VTGPAATLRQPPAPGIGVPELVIAGLLALLGLRSLLRWLGTELEGSSPLDRVLFALHATARVGLWLSLAVLFVGFALLDEPQRLRWYVFLPLGLAAVQLLTVTLLSRAPSPRPAGGMNGGPEGNKGQVPPAERPPGPLEPEKRGETAEPGQPQPQAAEVESARLLGNQARAALRAEGLTDEQIRRLADEYVARDRGEDLEGFIAWARDRARRGRA